MIAASTTGIPANGPENAEATGAYVPGVCNIGPAEIARRRRAGHVGAVATAGLLGVLIVADAPALLRLVVALPASVAAICYLEARWRFCAGLGSRGLFNFGPIGGADHVADGADRARDRAQGVRLARAGGAIGLATGVAAVLLPL